jgi:flagellar hook-associated protein FlgK
MQDAMRIGLSGMRAAEAAVAVRARNIANLNTKGYLPVEPVQKPVPGGVQTSVREVPLSPETQATLGDIPAEGERLADDLVNLHLAEIAYRASAAVVKTADRMAAAALDALG